MVIWLLSHRNGSKWPKRKVDNFMKASVQEQSPSRSSSDCPLDSLALPPQVASSLWEKANDLARDETPIVQAPGDDCAWMVRSSSSKRPHYVKVSKCSFICDDQCLSYKSMKVCSHTVAIAIKQESIEKFVKWYRTLKHTPNFSALAEAGKPTTTGKKPGRKGVSKKSSQQIKKIVDAEEAGLEWRSRGQEQCSHDSLDDVLEDPVHLTELECYSHSQSSTPPVPDAYRSTV